MKLRFIHSADNHIGSVVNAKFKENLENEELLKEATYDAFKKIIDYSLENEVDFLLLSGDVFDKNSYSVKGIKFFCKQCLRLKQEGIPVFMICGNHDALIYKRYKLNFPDNVYIFKENDANTLEFKKDECVVARIIGQSYKNHKESRELWNNYNLPQDHVFNIALLHTSLDNNKNYVPCTVANIMEKEAIDYWALGHVHKNRIIKEDGPLIVYPGIPQGRDFGEEGIGGFYVVDVMGKKASTKFIPTATVVYKNIQVNLNQYSKMDSLAELEEIICSEITEEAEKVSENIKTLIFQCTISGRNPISEILLCQKEEDIEQWIIDLNEGIKGECIELILENICLKISPEVEQIGISQQNYIYKTLEKVMKQYLEEENLRDELKEKMGRIWDKSEDYENDHMEKFILNEEEFNEIIQEAKGLILDKFFVK